MCDIQNCWKNVIHLHKWTLKSLINVVSFLVLDVSSCIARRVSEEPFQPLENCNHHLNHSMSCNMYHFQLLFIISSYINFLFQCISIFYKGKCFLSDRYIFYSYREYVPLLIIYQNDST